MDMQDLSPDLGGENQENSGMASPQDGSAAAAKAPRKPRARKAKATTDAVAVVEAAPVEAAPVEVAPVREVAPAQESSRESDGANPPQGDGAGEGEGEPRKRRRRRRRRGRGNGGGNVQGQQQHQNNNQAQGGDGQASATDGAEGGATPNAAPREGQQQRHPHQREHGRGQGHGRDGDRGRNQGRNQQRNQHPQQQHRNQPQVEEPDTNDLVEPDAPAFERTGVLEILPTGEGRLRQFRDGLITTDEDPIIPRELFEGNALRSAQLIVAECRLRIPSRRRQGGSRLPRATAERIVSIEGLEPAVYGARKPFAELTALDPQPRMTLEHRGCPAACRLIDLFCPIGYGTRGLIVAPPKAGKTILLQNLAFGIKQNHPEVELIALLIDERPEEVTDFKRNVPAHVIASSNDQDIERHLALGILAIERAKRMVEAGKDVVVLLDSLTRLGRAFNNSRKYGSSGRTMSGGLDSRALEVPKQLFGAARKCEEGGSLTIIATCLVDTGSRADQIIFEEFKGTGNMELILDRTISEKRIFPAINLAASGTRKEHLLMGENELKVVTSLRRRLLSAPPPMQIEQLLSAVKRYESNELMVGSG